jgi:hypothetical protein
MICSWAAHLIGMSFILLVPADGIDRRTYQCHTKRTRCRASMKATRLEVPPWVRQSLSLQHRSQTSLYQLKWANVPANGQHIINPKPVSKTLQRKTDIMSLIRKDLHRSRPAVKARSSRKIGFGVGHFNVGLFIMRAPIVAITKRARIHVARTSGMVRKVKTSAWIVL